MLHKNPIVIFYGQNHYMTHQIITPSKILLHKNEQIRQTKSVCEAIGKRI